VTPDIESIIARHTAGRAVIIGPVLVAAFWATRGADGAVGAAWGVVIVAGYLLLSGVMLSVAARISLAFYHAAALLGFFLRLGLIAVTMLAVARLTDIDRVAMGVAVVVAYLALLGWEAVAISRGREGEMGWTA
jgi:hypothetical protein